MHQPTSTQDLVANHSGLRERKKQQTRSTIHRSALALVTDRGLAGVTVEQICADAEVSPRTFFNYFPSKAEAALGLPATTVPDAARAAFLGSTGPLVSDLCDLVAQTVTLPQDRRRMKELVRVRPEMIPAMMQWTAHALRAVLAVAAERVDQDTARTATTLVMAAVLESAHRSADGPHDEFAARLCTVVAEMGRLATA